MTGTGGSAAPRRATYWPREPAKAWEWAGSSLLVGKALPALSVPDPFLLLVVFQIGGGVHAAAQTWQPRTIACWAVVISGAVGIGAEPVAGSEPSLCVSAGTPIIVRSKD